MRPDVFNASVVSELTKHCCHSVPDHASHTSGGKSGWTPTPSTLAPTSRRTTQRGTGLVSPTSSVSPIAGTSENARKAVAIFRPSPRSCAASWSAASAVPTSSSAHGTMSSSSRVLNMIDSSRSVRTVATAVPRGMPTLVTAGAESQKVTGAFAGVAASSRNPIISRNFTYMRSGTWLSR